MAGGSQLFDQFYNFPPFFTLQPTPPTRARQLDLWTKLLQSHCSASRQFTLTRNEDIFTNAEIKRNLDNDFVTHLFAYMIDNDAAIPHGLPSPSSPASTRRGTNAAGVDSVVIWFIPKEKWCERIYDYAKRNGLVNGGIATAFEILQDDEFDRMDVTVLGVLLRLMQNDRKCEVILDAAGQVEGVKFF